METIDYTKRRRGKAIVVCPKCGRKGLLRDYGHGAKTIVHVAERGPFAQHVRDCCFIPKAEQTR